jgi:hypothetical protein
MTAIIINTSSGVKWYFLESAPGDGSAVLCFTGDRHLSLSILFHYTLIDNTVIYTLR